MSLLSSQAEVDYCLLTLQAGGLRLDGRPVDSFRDCELSLGPIAQANGSARLRLGATDVLVGVKAEVGPTSKAHPDTGRLQFTVECSPCASPEYEGRGGEAWGQQLASALQAALLPAAGSVQGPASALLHSLAIIPGKAAWCLYVDCLVLNDAGGTLGALSIAARAALAATRLPRVTVTKAAAEDGAGGEEGEPEIELEDDGSEGAPLTGVDQLPVIISCGLLGSCWVVDPGLLEEQAARSVVHTAVDASGRVCGSQQEGRAAVPPADLMSAMHIAVSTTPKLLVSLTQQVLAHQEQADTGDLQ